MFASLIIFVALQGTSVLVLLAAVAGLILFAGTRSRSIVLALLIGFGIFARIAWYRTNTIDSDVLTATYNALHEVASLHNPYSSVYQSSGPYTYGPFEALFYAPVYAAGLDLRIMEIFSSIITVFLLLLLCREYSLIPISIYSSWQDLIRLSSDGDNDVSAGMITLLAAVLFFYADDRKSRKLIFFSAVCWGLAVSFKLFPVLFVPFLLAYLRANNPALMRGSFVLPVFLTVGGLSLPFIATAPRHFLHRIFVDNALRPLTPDRNFWAFTSGMGWGYPDYHLIPFIEIPLTLLALTILLLFRPRTFRSAMLFGIITWFVLLLFGPWFPYGYVGFIAPQLLALMHIDLSRKASGEPEVTRWEPHALHNFILWGFRERLGRE